MKIDLEEISRINCAKRIRNLMTKTVTVYKPDYVTRTVVAEHIKVRESLIPYIKTVIDGYGIKFAKDVYKYNCEFGYDCIEMHDLIDIYERYHDALTWYYKKAKFENGSYDIATLDVYTK